MSETMIRLDADFLHNGSVRRVFDVLERDGGQARIVGGAVRNHLLGQDTSDIDFATTLHPQSVITQAEAAGLKTVATGLEHGTVTIIVDKTPFEVTTLRADVETDGRRAVVAFCEDFETDSLRRDFTINALYCDRDGQVSDFHGGLSDLETPVTIRFIGDPEARIREDYLRILRFFRFFAWYGQGRPDAGGLKACARLKDGMRSLSAERIWQEMRKLLAAPDPARSLLWMRQAGVLTAILPESENWGIDEIHGLIDTENALGRERDPALRLMSMIPPSKERVTALSERWKLPNVVRDRLAEWADTAEIAPTLDDGTFEAMLYRGNRQAIIDRLVLDIAKRRARNPVDVNAMAELARLIACLERAEDWMQPQFPVSGKDLLAQGYGEGEELGAALARAQEKWIASRFTMDRDAILAWLAD